MTANLQEINPEFKRLLQNEQVTNSALAGSLAREYYAALYQVARFVQLPPHAARSCACRAILWVVKNRYHCTGEPSIRVWLYQMVVYSAYLQALGWGKPDAENAQFSHDERYLPERLPLILRYVHGLTLPEIAAVTGKRLSAVHNIFNRERQEAARQSRLNPLTAPIAETGISNAGISDAERMLDGPDYVHAEFRALACQSLDGLLETEKNKRDRERLTDHLGGCLTCGQYAASIEWSEQRLRQQVLARDFIPPFPEYELDVLMNDLEWQAGQKKKLPVLLSLKEFSLGLVATVLNFSSRVWRRI